MSIEFSLRKAAKSGRSRTFDARADEHWLGGRRFRVDVGRFDRVDFGELVVPMVTVDEYEGHADQYGYQSNVADSYPDNPMQTYGFPYSEKGATELTKFLHEEGISKSVRVVF